MFDEFLEDYKYNWKMADKKYMEECYKKQSDDFNLSQDQMDVGKSEK